MTISVLGSYGFPLGGYAASRTVSYTIPAGSDPVLCVVANKAMTSCTFGGVALTKIASSSYVNTLDVELWYLVGATGTADVVMNFSTESTYGPYIFFVLGGVDQSTPFGTPASDGGSWEYSPHSITLSLAAGQHLLGVWGCLLETTATSPDTLIYTESYDSQTRAVAITSADDGTVAFGTWEGQIPATVLGVPITPATGGVINGAANGGTGTGTGSGTGGEATGGTAAVDATATGGTGAGTGSGGGGEAVGVTSGSFTTSPMYSSGVLQASVALDWTWYPGAIGASPTSALVHGSGTTSVSGTLTATGLPVGSGFLLAETADGAIYYEAGTVA